MWWIFLWSLLAFGLVSLVVYIVTEDEDDPDEPTLLGKDQYVPISPKRNR